MKVGTTRLCGYGINATYLNPTIEQLKAYIAMAPQFEQNLTNWFREENRSYHTADVSEILDVCNGHNDYPDTNFGAIVRAVISEVEHIPLIAERSIYDDCYVIMPSYYPWEITPALLAIKNEHDIYAIFAKHTLALTDKTPVHYEWGEHEIEIETE